MAKDAKGSACFPQVASAWPQAPEDLSGQLPPGVIHRRPRHPQRQALSHWIGPGPLGEPLDPPGSQPGGFSLTPSLSLRDRLTTSAQLFGYGTRPGPNRVPARAPAALPTAHARMHRPQQALGSRKHSPTPTLPPRYSPLFRLTDQLFPKPAFPSPVEAGDYILIGS